MRVLHVPFGYYPDTCGGTEVYVAALCRELRGLGVTSVVAAPGSMSECYRHEETEVRRFPVNPNPSLEGLNGAGDSVAAAAFAEVLEAVRPELVHFHAFSPAVSGPVLAEARKRALATVFTYHTPTATCRRGTLMRWGTLPCDGEMRDFRCAACQLHSLGVSRPLALAAAWASPMMKHAAPWVPRTARWQVPLRAHELTALRHDRARHWLGGMDRIIALCEWTRKLLAINAVPSERVRMVRHGLTQLPASQPQMERAVGTVPRFIFLGRLDPTKGLHLLLEALEQAPELRVQVDVFTLLESVQGRYVTELLARLRAEPRITLCPPVPSAEVLATLQGYDALLVPSQWFETGPLVVLEAFAAGVPVIGSDLGGIAEWVTHERDGLLVPQPTGAAWRAALQRTVDEPALLPRLRSAIRPPRSMRDVAREVHQIYLELRVG